MALQLWEHLLLAAAPPAGDAKQQQDRLLYENFFSVYVDPVLVRVTAGSRAEAGGKPRTPSESGEARPAPPNQAADRPAPPKPRACPMPDLVPQVCRCAYRHHPSTMFEFLMTDCMRCPVLYKSSCIGP